MCGFSCRCHFHQDVPMEFMIQGCCTQFSLPTDKCYILIRIWLESFVIVIIWWKQENLLQSLDRIVSTRFSFKPENPSVLPHLTISWFDSFISHTISKLCSCAMCIFHCLRVWIISKVAQRQQQLFSQSQFCVHNN